MNPAGSKSDESNQFSQLEIWNLGLVHQFESAVALGFGAESASALIKAAR
jgi:hypothetical protein